MATTPAPAPAPVPEPESNPASTTVNADRIETALTSVSIGDTAGRSFVDLSIDGLILPDRVTGLRVGETSASVVFHPGDDASLGQRKGYLTEPRWEASGGSLGITHCNQETGASIAFFFRVNHNEELEIVKKTELPNSEPVFQEVFKTGRTQVMRR